jgi:putative glutamine transport system permease protein
MTVFTSAMVAEIVRGGLNGVPHGQWEAARSQGFTLWQTLRYIILPQACETHLHPDDGTVRLLPEGHLALARAGCRRVDAQATIIIGKYRYASQVILIYALVAGIYVWSTSSFSKRRAASRAELPELPGKQVRRAVVCPLSPVPPHPVPTSV